MSTIRSVLRSMVKTEIDAQGNKKTSGKTDYVFDLVGEIKDGQDGNKKISRVEIKIMDEEDIQDDFLVCFVSNLTLQPRHRMIPYNNIQSIVMDNMTQPVEEYPNYDDARTAVRGVK
jgi:hypothetical protein